MRIRYFIPLVMVAGGVTAIAIGCGETQPTGPTNARATGDSSQSHPGATPARNEWLAQRVALALGNPGFRAYVWAQIQHSPIREHKLQFQRFLAVANWRALKTIAQVNGDSDDAVLAQGAQAQPLEFYMPVKSHLASWHADENVLVATAVADHDAPVAFDTKGRRYVLDAEHPPETPVLALVPVETDFDSPPARIQCTPTTCGDGGGSPLQPPPAGLYMKAAHIPDAGQFEGWLKGDPEFEVHILGQMGTTDQLTDYQCAGEHAGGPYYYDQNTDDWWGDVLLFSQDQLTAYKARHPGQGVRVFLVEDDDQACELRMDTDRVHAMMLSIDSAYALLTGGRDSTVSKLNKVFHYARVGQDLLSALASFINSNDDPVGNAVQDAVVGQYYPGYNWFIKADHNITKGWIDLEMH
ncbi:MAG TPA: hypothetical protein VH163_10980 [Gemmatimonadales bacterium]|jgi:hypothetical protein|nr:hypothetical protein [Gemmatimonadales bacterium]